jgi:hypothetical protein
MYNKVSFYNIFFYKTKQTNLTKNMYGFLLSIIIYLQNIKHGEEFTGEARDVYIYKYLTDYYKKIIA